MRKELWYVEWGGWLDYGYCYIAVDVDGRKVRARNPFITWWRRFRRVPTCHQGWGYGAKNNMFCRLESGRMW